MVALMLKDGVGWSAIEVVESALDMREREGSRE